MTLKHLFATLTLASCTLLAFTACDDEDYAPITLEIQNGSGRIENNTLQLDAFCPGESFYIVGGNGRYIIDNQSKDIIDYKYDGHTLTFIPVGIGKATVVISDHAGNKMRLTIEVTNHTTAFKVIDLEANAYGDEMTGGNMKKLEKQMIDESLLKVGGDILFTYTNQEQTLGSVVIHPTASGRPISGIFRQERRFSDKKVPYLEFIITLADNRVVTWKLLNYSEEATKEMILIEDVTNTYKGTYSQLEKATLTYTITH